MSNTVIPVLVEFKINDHSWHHVIADAKPNENVGHPTMGDGVFYLSYPDKKSWINAFNRFGNQVEHKVVNAEFSLA